MNDETKLLEQIGLRVTKTDNRYDVLGVLPDDQAIALTEQQLLPFAEGISAGMSMVRRCMRLTARPDGVLVLTYWPLWKRVLARLGWYDGS